MKKFSLLLLFLVYLSPAPTEAARGTLHAILVCDTFAENIEESVRSDLRHMQELAKKLSKETHYKLNMQVFSDNKVKPILLEKIQGIEFKPNDLVIFYFSGHGYNISPPQSCWPKLYLTPSQQSLDFLELFDLLKGKSPQLLIAIADCCNNILPSMCAPRSAGFFLERGSRERSGYNTLFTLQKGTILISGSSYSEFTWCTTSGGLFTNAWIDALKQEVGKKNPSWAAIMATSRGQVISYNLQQTPQFMIDLTEIQKR